MLSAIPVRWFRAQMPRCIDRVQGCRSAKLRTQS
jgi:hypothetical protein